MSIRFKGATPSEGESLCRSCRHVHMQKGFRESDEAIFCAFVYDRLRPLPFKVRECTDYVDRHRPSAEQMEEMAIYVDKNSTLKPAGFLGVKASRDDECE